MKHFFTFLRSMKFGIALLLLVIVCSLVGSFMPQDRAASWYSQKYPGAGSFILSLGLDNVFSRWYFILLIVLLCANLMLCSVIRFNQVRKMKKKALLMAKDAVYDTVIGAKAADKLRTYLCGKHFRQDNVEDATVFYKNMFGHYGSFVIHLSILLTLIFSGLTLRLSETTDYSVMPGSALTLPDGTQLVVDSFRLADETGRIDYASVIHVMAPDGSHSGSHEISVNYPFSFKSNKYYQFSYGTAGSITALNTQTDGADQFYLTERSFLSSDGRNGIWFEALYPGYVLDEEGNITPLTFTSGIYPDPVYQVIISDSGTMTSRMALPGDTVQTGDISFTFNAPVNYPGIRNKHTPTLFLGLLYSSFVLMIFGFWLCFFHVPVIITVRHDSYLLSGSKTAGIQLEIELLLTGMGKQ